MKRYEMNEMSQWLRDRADEIESTEPYATNEIGARRTAADEVDSAESDDD